MSFDQVLVSRGPANHRHEFICDQDAPPLSSSSSSSSILHQTLENNLPTLSSPPVLLSLSLLQAFGILPPATLPPLCLVSYALARSSFSSVFALLLLPRQELALPLSLSLSPSLCLNLLLRPSRQAHSDHIPHTTRTGRIRTLNVCLAPQSVHPELITARHMTNNRHV